MLPRKLHVEEDNEKIEFVRDQRASVNRVVGVVIGASKELLGLGDANAPNLIMRFEPYFNAVKASSEGLIQRRSRRYITNITADNTKSCKVLLNDLGIDVRHLEQIRSNVVMSEKEMISDLSQPHPNSPRTKLPYSNVAEFLDQQKEIFEALWKDLHPCRPKDKRARRGTRPADNRDFY